MLDLIVKNCVAVTMDDDCPVIRDAYLAVRGGKLDYVGAQEPQEGAWRTIDARGQLCMPGLINTHSHAAMTLMRGYADDHALQEWLFRYVFPVEDKLDGEAVALGTQLAMAEMLASGTVSFSDMYMFIPAMARVIEECGMYANISNGITAFEPDKYDYDKSPVTAENREVLARWHGADGGRIRLDASIHAEYTSFPPAWRDFAAFARENGLNLQLHLSETKKEQEECIARWGKTPARVMADNGVFDVRTTAAHGVWLTDEDLDLLAEKGVTVAHNPVSNLKLASGVARVTRMLEKGVRVSLGTDGVCSNNNYDLFEEIKLAAILQKGVTGDPRVIPAGQALRMATRAGAYAQGRENELGCLKAGFDASFILVDTSRPGLMPLHDPQSALAYAARGGDVSMTVVRGRVLYEKGEYTTLDMERIRAGLGPVMKRLFGA